MDYLVANLGWYTAAAFGVGFVVAWIAKVNGVAAKVSAVVLLVFFIPVHYMLWDKFPLWYHLTFLVSLVLLTIAGAMLKVRAS